MKSTKFFTLAVALSVTTHVFGQTIRLVHTFNDPTPTDADFFGYSVALNGQLALIGAQWDQTHGLNVGQAHLYDLTTVTLLHTFDQPNPGSNDFFGSSVALGGNYTLIGADARDSIGGAIGQAYLFNNTTRSLARTFDDPTPTDTDRFGCSVAVDGNYALVGAWENQTNNNTLTTGQAHLFNVTTGTLMHTFKNPHPSSLDHFGRFVALDGNYALIGAWGDDTNGLNVGQAHLFDVTTGSLIRTFNNPTPTAEDAFGLSVAIDGNYALIGASGDDTNGLNVGQAYLFDITSGSLLHTFNDPRPTREDRFGNYVALDGNHALIGAALDDTNGIDVGQAHLFDTSSGSLLYTFDDPTPTLRDAFGSRVAIKGNNVLIGAPEDDTIGFNIGQAHLFSIPEPSTALLSVVVVFLVLSSRLCLQTGQGRV